MSGIINVRKRNGDIHPFNAEKITRAIYKAANAVGGSDFERAEALCKQVVDILSQKYDNVVEVEDIQDVVEKVLIDNRHARTAKAYILYREKRKSAREANALTGATIGMFQSYLNDDDWRIKENANQARSVNGLNNFVREEFTQRYWLSEVYPMEIANAHMSGDMHIHDLGFFGPYCAGWDLRQLLTNGFGGVPGKVESGPAKHLRSFLGQIVNSTFTTQGETAGAQAWSSIDTYCAPFIRYDGLTFKQVKQALQEFIFNLNVPTRVGFQCPFSNLTFDIKCPKTLANEKVLRGGQMTDDNYGDFQEEMDIFNLAFFEVMLAGDVKGRVFTFPIPTINVTRDFDWNSPVVNKLMDITCKYGIPYFSNYINSDLSPEDAVSMCCRLRLDTTELRKRGGALFGSNPMTGSIGVVTINLPRIGFLANNKEEYFKRLSHVCDLAKNSLDIKRKIIEDQTNKGLYPYSAYYLRDIKARSGNFWDNHFNTIGIVGMNEACENFLGKSIASDEGQAFALETMNFLREKMQEYQKESGSIQYNLEATPAEGTSFRLAKLDRERFPNIIASGEDVAYYTNSTQLPVDYTSDIFETLTLQDELQSLYTGGTVLHLYLGQKIDDPEQAKMLIQKVFTQFKLPYMSLTPSFSVCPTHGYLAGEVYTCQDCGSQTEVWSRVTGYLRPVRAFNKGKTEEFRQRIKYQMPALS